MVCDHVAIVNKEFFGEAVAESHHCLLYTSDAADERSSVDLGGRRIIKKKKNDYNVCCDKTTNEITEQEKQMWQN